MLEEPHQVFAPKPPADLATTALSFVKEVAFINAKRLEAGGLRPRKEVDPALPEVPPKRGPRPEEAQEAGGGPKVIWPFRPPQERRAEAVSFPVWCRQVVKLVLQSRTPFASFLKSTLRLTRVEPLPGRVLEGGVGL